MGMIFSIAPLAMPWWAYLILLTLTLSLAILRMIRFVTADSLGEWLREPIMRWARVHEGTRRKAISASLVKLSNEDKTPAATQYLQDQLDQLEDDEPMSWQARLASGLECPFCSGFHIAWVMIVLTLLCVTVPVLSIIWHVILAALAINYITAHISAKLD